VAGRRPIVAGCGEVKMTKRSTHRDRLRTAAILCLPLGALALAGCSSGPSESDYEQAVKESRAWESDSTAGEEDVATVVTEAEPAETEPAEAEPEAAEAEAEEPAATEGESPESGAAAEGAEGAAAATAPSEDGAADGETDGSAAEEGS
jgi:hypothetical protein